jgi:hypothetical protein
LVKRQDEIDAIKLEAAKKSQAEIDALEKQGREKKFNEILSDQEKIITDYVNSLNYCLIEYKKNYPHLDSHLPAWGIVESYNIQKYQPSEAFFEWHFERTHGLKGSEKRLLVFMTYLNTVKDEGETEFFYQKLKVKPEEGLTLIWPAHFTHFHKGQISKKYEKYIITGWYTFVN